VAIKGFRQSSGRRVSLLFAKIAGAHIVKNQPAVPALSRGQFIIAQWSLKNEQFTDYPPV
jgi:hypothetical protein